MKMPQLDSTQNAIYNLSQFANSSSQVNMNYGINNSSSNAYADEQHSNKMDSNKINTATHHAEVNFLPNIIYIGSYSNYKYLNSI